MKELVLEIVERNNRLDKTNFRLEEGKDELGNYTLALFSDREAAHLRTSQWLNSTNENLSSEQMIENTYRLMLQGMSHNFLNTLNK